MERIGDRARLCDLALPDIATLPDGIFRRMVVERLAETAQVDIGVLEGRLGQTPRPPARAQHPTLGGSTAVSPSTALPPRGPSSQGGRPSLMRNLLRMLVLQPTCVRQIDEHQRDAFVAAVQGTSLQPLVEYLVSNPESDTSTLVARFLGDPTYNDLSALAKEELEVPEVMTEFRDGVARLLQERNNAERRAMGKNLTLAIDDTKKLGQIGHSLSEAAARVAS